MTDIARQRVGARFGLLRSAVGRRPTLTITAGLILTSLYATLSNAPGRYIGDNRFEQFWAPGHRILRETALWDGGRGLGRVAEEFWPSTIVIGLLRAVGMSPTVAERVWHASILVLAGVAVVHLVSVFIPKVGAVHAVAAFAYAFNPFTAVFLLPSVLFWNYAIAPLIVLALVRGVEQPRAWRWPAGLALTVFVAGNADLPGTAYSLLLLVPTALYLTVVAGTASWRDVGRVLARATLLVLVCSAAAFTKTTFGSASLESRLAATELPRRVNVASSWSESWRGLGFWLSYFGDADDLGRLPGGRYFWESPAGAFATFLAPLAAMVAVVWTRWRPRWLFAGLALTSIVLMVGSYPPDDASPLGRLILWTFENVAALSSLRNTYKAGAGLALAVATLLGVVAATAARRLHRQHPLLRRAPYAVAAAVIVASALPFLNGGLYPERAQLEDIPDYWDDALEFVDRQPGNGRVLVLPGTTKTAYRWGWPGDDIFDASLSRHPNVISNAFPLSEPLAASAIDAIDDQVTAGTIAPGAIASVARRLGITQVIIRNDLDWDRSQVARPNDLQPIRRDPSLVLAASFGAEGENVVGTDDTSVDGRLEAALPPVEVYDVTSAPGPLLARSAPAPAVVAGDGSAMALIGAAQAVEDGRPIRFSGELDDTEIVEAVTGGGPIVLTDTNRRQVVRIRGAVPTTSETLGVDQELDQPPRDLWERPGSQTTAVHPDADQVSATSSGVRLIGYQPWLRPANAFDGNPATYWLTGGLEDPVGNRIRVDFDETVELSSLRLVPFRPQGTGRTVASVRIHVATGDPITVALSADDATDVSFPSRRTDFVDIEIASVSRSGEAAVGFREVEVPGLDLVERIRVPDDLFLRADSDPNLAAALADAPTTYLFERRIGRGELKEEVALRRQFQSLNDGEVAVAGSLSIDRNLNDAAVSELLAAFDGTDVRSWGSSRFRGDLANRGEQATDGELDTRVGVRADDAAVLTVAFPEQAVDDIRVRTLGAGAVDIESLIVVVAGQPIEVGLERDPTVACEDGACARVAVVTLPTAVEVDAIEVRLGATIGDAELPARIAEVEVSGPDGPVATGQRRGDACADGLVTIDERAVGLQLGGDGRDGLGDGDPTPFTACGTPRLDVGEHELDVPSRLVDRLSISVDADAVTPIRGQEPTVEVLERTPDRLTVQVDAPEGAWVSTAQSYAPGWNATADDEDLGAPVPLDGQAAWRLPAGRHIVQMTFGPSRYYRAALLVTGLGVVVCIGLVARPRRRGET